MNCSDDIKQLQVALLQLQKSALIDTQSIMQLLLDKEICTVDEILNAKSRIESESPEVKRIGDQIINLGGQVIESTQKLNPGVKEQLNVLKGLIEKMTEEGKV